MNNLDTYHGKKILITGHTGFKGSWLTLWLGNLGAEVIGYSLPPETTPSHFDLIPPKGVSIMGDIRDRKKLQKVIADHRPEVVFHLAAQPLVRRSYLEPAETFETNVMGTVNILDACRQNESVKAILVITSDKCYENREWVWSYRENDPMGGYDPYSASKGAAELVTAAYRRSFFNNEDYGKTHETLVATCRAGNVIGGGDWSEDRLIPDIVRAIQKGETLQIRSPEATRPWQHVLDALSGYLLLGQKLLEGNTTYADAWNFGPSDTDTLRVRELCARFEALWPTARFEWAEEPPTLHEASTLKLDCSKAHTLLQWHGKWSADQTIEKTVEWYRHYIENKEILSQTQLEQWRNQ